MSMWRGHAITEMASRSWTYADTGQLVSENPARACGHCDLPNTPEGYDASLGELPGVMNACCGHGSQHEAYVQLVDGRRLAGSEAIGFIKTALNHPILCAPPCPPW